MNTVTKTAGCAALLGLALTGCKLPEPEASAGDVVVATSMSRNGDTETHYAECASNPTARVGEYQVVIPAHLDYELRAGDPCPPGPHEPTPPEKYPELYEQMRKAMNEPLPYEGGTAATCGEWGTTERAEARRLLAECPPLTRGEL